MPTRPLLQPDLDAMVCTAPNCNHKHDVMILSPACHPAKPVHVHYSKNDGTLKMFCSVCDSEVAEIGFFL